MRRLPIKLSAIPAILLLCAPPIGARTQRGRGPVNAIQPTESTRQLVVLARPGWAQVVDDGERHEIALRPEETLSTVAETTSGWIAGGVRLRETGASVFIVSSDHESDPRLPAIPQTGRLQLRPVLLVHASGLLGAAWLEGDNQRELSVRFSAWEGIDWAPPRTVSRPGRGSQTGLTGTTLANGEILLAWSRFDGSDDEIYWSMGGDTGWSRPARLGTDNTTPDITPVLASSGKGAKLVWGRMDSEYRILEADFQSGEWRSERVVSAPGGAFPTLVRAEGRLLALYRTAKPLGWAVADLDSTSTPIREARQEDAGDRRPVLTRMRAYGPVLEWHGEARSATPRWSVPHP